MEQPKILLSLVSCHQYTSKDYGKTAGPAIGPSLSHQTLYVPILETGSQNDRAWVVFLMRAGADRTLHTLYRIVSWVCHLTGFFSVHRFEKKNLDVELRRDQVWSAWKATGRKKKSPNNSPHKTRTDSKEIYSNKLNTTFTVLSICGVEIKRH